MTSGDIDALEALNRRLEHVQATARLIAVSIGASSAGDVEGAIWGIATTVEELSDRLDLIINSRPAPEAA